MSGSLCQLASTGRQSETVTASNEFTPFKVHVRRMTAFAQEPKEITFNGQIAYGKTAVASISRNADLLGKMHLVIETKACTSMIPSDDGSGGDTTSTTRQAQFRAVQDVARAMIESVTLEAGSVVYETIIPEWDHMWETLVENQERLHQELTGRSNVGTAEDGSLIETAYKNNRFYVPLNFFFTRSYGHALPIVALHLTDVQIKVKLRRKEEILVPLKVSGTTLIDDTASTVKPSATDMAIDNMYIVGEYIFLSDAERRRYARAQHVYLIEQVQQAVFTVPTSSKSYSASLSFNHPTKAFYWFGQKATHKNKGELFSWDGCEEQVTVGSDNKVPPAASDGFASHGDLFDTASITLNSNVRVKEMGPKYYRILQPRMHHTRVPEKQIYMYSFALEPESMQPSGHLNCSRIEKSHLHLKFGKATTEPIDLNVFAQNYNVVRIASGISSLAWAS